MLFGAAALGASAQYLCTDKGTVMTYEVKTTDDNKTTTVQSQNIVEDVVTAPDGIVTVRCKTVMPKPNGFGEDTSYSYTCYNPVTKVTTDTILSAAEYKRNIIEGMVEAARQAGHFASDEDIMQLDRMVRTKGDIILDVPDEVAPDTKIPNKSIRITVEASNMSINFWEAKFVGTETVETPAGTFPDCLKMTFVLKINTPENVEKRYCTGWYSKGIGEIKTVEADKKGNILMESTLTSIKK